jgi:ubiquinone biosynthesis protein COQ9
MTGNNLNDRDDAILRRLDIFGGTIRRIDTYIRDESVVTLRFQVNDVNITIHGLDTAEAFAAALAEGIDVAHRLVEYVDKDYHLPYGIPT